MAKRPPKGDDWYGDACRDAAIARADSDKMMPAPRPPSLDAAALAELVEKRKKMTWGRWIAATNPHPAAVEAQKVAVSVYGPDCLIYTMARDYSCLPETWERQQADAEGIVALVNAAPALLQMAETLLALHRLWTTSAWDRDEFARLLAALDAAREEPTR